MSECKLWCWEAMDHGPDWVFSAHVTPESTEALEHFAKQSILQDYVYCAEEKFCHHHHQTCQNHIFIDSSNFDDFRSQRNLWIFNMFHIHKDIIEIVCGYGGRGGIYNRVETSLLLNIFTSPQITLHNWKVIIGGNFYDYKTLSEGKDLKSLTDYLV
ncbi:MAG: hypothetical protein U0V02_06295 [Anaerolineales bacterium]